MADMTDDSQPAEYIDSKPNTFESPAKSLEAEDDDAFEAVEAFEVVETFESLDWDDEVEVPQLALGPSATPLGARDAGRAAKTGAVAGAAMFAALLGLAYSVHRRSRPRSLLSRL